MNHEERYKELVGNIKKAYLYAQTDSTKSVLEEILPELKESEDERIRKDLIGTIHLAYDCGVSLNKEQHDKAIVWLEKQVSPDMVADAYLRGCNDTKKKWLEKQGNNSYLQEKIESFTNAHKGEDPEDIIAACRGGENQSSNSVTITKGNTSVTNAEVVSHPTVIDFDGGKCTTASTTIEPMFKVGDWVVKGNVIAQILDVQEQYYIGLDTEGKDFTASRFLSDDKIHLWTIKDAKDGCVLACKDVIYLSHGYTKSYEQFHAYFGVSLNGTPSTFVNEYCCLAYKDEVLPATKEQRDTLFAKLEKAGYEFDAEKKELKLFITNGGDFYSENCEQNPTWSAEDESDIIEEGDPQPMSYGKELDEKMYKACKLYNNGEYSQADLFFAGVRAEYERAKKNVIEWKPADNTYYNDICGILYNILRSERYDTINKDAIRNDLDWLKSLKQRIGE